MSFEFLQVNQQGADENIAYAKSKIKSRSATDALFTQEMANIPETNIQHAKRLLNESIQLLKDNLDKAKVSDRIPAGVVRQCPQGWSGNEPESLVCAEPLTTHPCPNGWNEDGPLSCRANLYYDPCPPGTNRIGDTCHHPVFCKQWWGFPGAQICVEYGGGQSDYSPVRGGQVEPRKITGGRLIGKMNLPQDGGNLLRCPDDRPDYIDGLCYARCPANRPYHLNGMPYLCVQSQDVGKLIKDEWDFNLINKPQADHDIACAEGIRDGDEGKMKNHCGQSMNDYYKGWGEEIGANVLGFATLGVADLAATAGAPVWEKIFGHQPYSESDQKHAQGVVDAMASAKWMSKQKACQKAIENKSLESYLTYCELFAPELDPTTGQAKPDSQVAILPTIPEVPPEDLVRGLSEGINYDPKWIEEQIPVVPTIDESKIPPYPAWLNAVPSPAETPPGRKNMVKTQPPPDGLIPMAIGLGALIFLLG